MKRRQFLKTIITIGVVSFVVPIATANSFINIVSDYKAEPIDFKLFGKLLKGIAESDGHILNDTGQFIPERFLVNIKDSINSEMWNHMQRESYVTKYNVTDELLEDVWALGFLCEYGIRNDIFKGLDSPKRMRFGTLKIGIEFVKNENYFMFTFDVV